MQCRLQNLNPLHVDPPATDQLDQSLARLRAGVGDRMPAGLTILDDESLERTIDAALEPDPGAKFLRLVIGIVIEDVRTDDNIARVFDEQISRMAAVDDIPGDRH